MLQRIVAAALIGLALASCGLKDDLYLPTPAQTPAADQPTPEPTDEKEADEAP